MQHFLLEQALNYLISNEAINIEPLEGKIVQFSLQDLPLDLDINFVCRNQRIFVLSDTSTAANVNIKLKADVFLSLFQGEELTTLLKQDRIVIHGDVKTAQLIVDLLKETDIDLEEILSQYTGDIVAHQVGKFSKKLKQSGANLQNPVDAIKDGISTLLINPSKSELFKNKQH